MTAGLLYGDPCLGAMAAVGCGSATATAALLGMESGAISAGLMGYNGALVGCGFSVFLGAPLEPTIAATILGGSASAVLAARLGKMLPMPQWTLAFNAVALAALAYVRPFANNDAVEEEAVPLELSDVGGAALTGISQIFVVNNPISGALILAGIAAYSPAAAAAALFGSLLGIATAVAVGADGRGVKDGLWGYNPALTALAVSVFFVPGWQPLALATGGALATALVTTYCKDFFASTLQTPALTIPFCLVASGCFFLGGRLPGLRLAASPHSPEVNWRAFLASK